MSTKNQPFGDFSRQQAGASGPWLHPSRTVAHRTGDWPAGWWILPAVVLGAVAWAYIILGVIGLF